MNKGDVKKYIVSPDIFKIIFFIVSIIGVCPIISMQITPFLKLFHVYAIVVIGFDIIGEKRILRNKGRWVLFIFAISYIVTLLSNTNLLNFSGISNIGYLFITLSIVYSYGTGVGKLEKIGANVICTVITLANLIGIIMFFIKISIEYEGRGYIGMFPYENRLCGLFGNPNVLGMVCLIGISLCCINYVSCENRKIKKIYILALIINYITLLLSNSRTQIYSFVFMGMVFCFLYGMKNKCSIVNSVKTLAITLIVGILLLESGKIVQKGLSFFDFNYNYYMDTVCLDVVTDETIGTEDTVYNESIESVDENIIENEINSTQDNQILEEISEDINSDVEDEKNEKVQTTITRNSSGFNGRLELWQNGLILLKDKPLFGNGLDNHDYSLLELGYEPLPVRGNLHNVYLEILVCCGICGFICFGIFIIILIKQALFFILKNKENSIQIIVIASIIAGFMLDGVADSTLIASVYPTEIAFWYFISLLMKKVSIEENSKKIS